MASKKATSDGTQPASKTKRTRAVRPYPAVAFKEAISLGEAIVKFASGEKVRRLTLLEQINKKPTSSTTKQLITDSGKYGITKGSYSADNLELTADGKVACNPKANGKERLKAKFKLAIKDVVPFKLLYEKYVDKPLPVHSVLMDALRESKVKLSNPKECVDLFIVNTKDLGLLRTIAGTETLVAIDHLLSSASDLGNQNKEPGQQSHSQADGGVDWDRTCFYITPIGDEGSEARRHADLFMKSLVEPAMKDLGLTVVRADKIGSPGMITTNIIEYIRRSKLAIADLSTLNPNVFYEVALRHACRLPVVQLIRKADRLPFDVNQVSTIVVDTSDIYTLVPRIETHRSEIATAARESLRDPERASNPVSVFYPDFWE